MRKKGLLIICVLMFFTLTSMVFAEEKKNPLSLVEVATTSGSEVVELTDVLTLEFSNNVVNMSVQENNMKCFSVTDSDGNPVDVEIFMGDDQVDRDIKRLVEIRPKGQWSEGETYTILVSGELSGKNGMLLTDDVTYEFKTVGSKEESGSNMTYLYIAFALVGVAGGYFIARK